jgi:hypothetical protein
LARYPYSILPPPPIRAMMRGLSSPSLLIRPEQGLWVICDGCGGRISSEDPTLPWGSTLEIWLDSEQCVSYGRSRDYCLACLNPIWAAINALIMADPEAEWEDSDEC